MKALALSIAKNDAIQKKTAQWLRALLALGCVFAMVFSTTALAEEMNAQGQIVTAGATVYYDGEGNETSNTTFPGGDALVELKKTVQPTGTENQFEVTLDLRTTQNLRVLKTDTPDAAAMLILDVSSSMDDCAECGNSEGKNHRWNYGHAYESRLDQAQKAAKDFLDEFAGETGAQDGDARYVAIVDFGSKAVRRLNWVDVTNEASLKAAKELIDSLTTAHSNTQWAGTNGGGTNIEAGLMLGANVWKSNADVLAIDHKYTILLTDGYPTFHVSDDQASTTENSVINGTYGGGNYTKEADAKDVGKQAARITGTAEGIKSKLYSICYGQEKNNNRTTKVWDSKPFGNWGNASPATAEDMTVGQWLSAFSTNAYDGSASQNLFDSFTSIVTQIKYAANAWKVTDTMGPYAVYGSEVKQAGIANEHTYENGVLNWDVRNSSTISVTNHQVGEHSYVVLAYKFKYTVTLDNLNQAYKAKTATGTNASAVLDYALYNENTGLWSNVYQAEFPEPQVQGYEATLQFRKMYIEDGVEKPVSGAKFVLVPAEGEASATGTTWTSSSQQSSNGIFSSGDGYVEFTNIPSGHRYYLQELNPGDFGFSAPGNVLVEVNWGKATSPRMQDGKFYNLKSNRSVSLTLQKTVTGIKDTSSLNIPFKVTDAANFSRDVVLNAKNGWKSTLSGLKPGRYTITETADLAGYDVDVSATFEGASVPVTNGAVAVDLLLDENESTHDYSLSFTNAYERRVGSLAVRKTFLERDHEDLISGNVENAKLTPMDEELYRDLVVTIQLRTPEGGDAGLPPLVLKSPDWTADLANIPEGEYLLDESLSGAIADHEFVHAHVTVDGKELTSEKITITNGTNLAIAVENHYSHHMGDIHVFKEIESAVEGETIAVPEDHLFHVNVYPAVQQADGKYVKDGDEPVTTIRIRRSATGEWGGTSVDIPVGWYWLEEAENSVSIPGYTLEDLEFSPQVVEVKHSADGARAVTAYTTLTNTYSLDKGTLTVYKEFVLPPNDDDFEYPPFINVHVLNAENKVVEILKLESSGDQWIASAELPLGSYTLDEVSSLGAEGTADVKNYGHKFEWSPSNSVVIEKDAEAVARTVRNTYTRDYGHLQIAKSFTLDGEEAKALNFAVEFEVQQLGEDGNYRTVDTLLLDSTEGYTKTVDLPTGKYRVIEKPSAHDGLHTLEQVSITIDGKTTTLSASAASLTGFEVEITGQDDVHNTVEVSAVNAYTTDKGDLVVRKAFHPDSELKAEFFSQNNRTINVHVHRGGSHVATLGLNDENNWEATLPDLEIGTYLLIEEHGETAENTASVTDYALSYEWSGGAEVQIDRNAESVKAVTNRYTRKTGLLYVRKFFSGLASDALTDGKEIRMSLTDAAGKEYGPIILSNANNWLASNITLPVGTYTLTESGHEIPGYTHLNVAFASALSSGNVTQTAGSLSATVQVTDAPDGVRVQVTNNYQQDLGDITVTKAFAADEQTQEAKKALGDIDVLISDANGKAVATLTLGKDNGYTATTGKLPVGEYTLREVIAQGADHSAFVDNFTVVPSWSKADGKVTVAKNANSEITVTNTYTVNKGELRVQKNVVSHLDEDQGRTFTFDIALYPAITYQSHGSILSGSSVIDANAPVQFVNGRATISLKHGETRVIELPAKMQYTVTEQEAAGFAVSSSGDKGTVSASVVSTAAFTNTRMPGGFKVTKQVVSGSGEDQTRQFAFTATLTPAADGEYAFEKSTGAKGLASFKSGQYDFTLAHDQSIVFRNLPSGTQVKVTETPVDGFSTAVQDDETGDTNGEDMVTLVSGQMNEILFTNTRAAGELKITKEVKEPVVAADRAVRFTFTVALSDDTISGTFPMSHTGSSQAAGAAQYVVFTNGQAQISMYHGDTLMISGLPQGTGYTVTEQVPDGYVLASSDGANGTISDTLSHAAFINERSAVGTVTITKMVNSPLTEDRSKKFIFTATLMDADGTTPISGQLGNAVFDENGQYVFEMEHADQHRLINLPVGARLTIKETADPRFDTIVSDGSGYEETVVVTKDTVQTVNYVNERKQDGNLAVQKTVSSNLDTDLEKAFTFTILLSDDDQPASFTKTLTGELSTQGASEKQNVSVSFSRGQTTITLKHNQTLSLTGLPEGLAYKVQEAEYAGFDAESENASGSLAVGSYPTAKFTNTRASGVLVVRKHVVSDLASDNEIAFDFEIVLKDQQNQPVTGQHGALLFDEQGKASFALKHGESIAISSLQEGTYTYTVTEKSVSGFDTTYTVTSDTTSSMSEEGKATGELKPDDISLVLVTNTRQEGSLVVSKRVVSDRASDSQRTFDFTITLTPAVKDGTYGDIAFEGGVGKFSLRDGEWKTVTGLPTGVSYKVEEAPYSEFITTSQGETGTILASSQSGQQRAGEAAAAFVNTRKTGEIYISKQVVSNVHADHEQQFAFTITLYDGSDMQPANVTQTYPGTIQTRDPDDGSLSARTREVGFLNGVTGEILLRDGQTLSISGLPAGMRIKVQEVKAEGYTTTVDGQTTDKGSLEVAAGIDNAKGLAFVNTRDTAPLSVTKQLGTHALASDASRPFNFSMLLTGAHGAPVSGTFTYQKGATRGEAVVGPGGVFNFQLKADETLTLLNLPIGAVYSIAESADPVYVVSAQNAQGTIAAGGSSAVFTNDRRVAGLTIAKTVAEPKAAEDPTSFQFRVTLSDTTVNDTIDGVKFTNGVATVTVDAGSSTTITGIPAEMQVLVQEVSDDRYVAESSENGFFTLDPAAGKTVTFANERKTGSMSIVKNVEGELLENDPTVYDFTVKLSRKMTGTLDVKKGTALNEQIVLNDQDTFSVKVARNERITINGIPTGLTASVQEQVDNALFVSVWENGRNQVSILPGITETITCRNTRTSGSLTIAKKVQGTAASANKAFEFSFFFKDAQEKELGGVFAYSGTKNGVATTGVLSNRGKLYLHGGDQITVQLPAGVKYVVKESNPQGALVSITSATGTIDPDQNAVSGTITSEASSAEFLNTLNTGVTIQKISEGIFVEDENQIARYPSPEISIHALGSDEPLWKGTVPANGAPVALNKLLPAGQYEVREQVATVADHQSIASLSVNGAEVSGNCFTVQDGDVALGLKIVNRYTPKFGFLTIQKIITGSAANPQDVFQFSLALRNADGTILTGEYPCTINGATAASVQDGSTIRLHGGDIAVIRLPVGTRYEVLETDSFGYLLTESTGTNGQIVPAGEAASQACFTNELSYSVSVKKEWIGDSKATRPAEVQIQLLHNGQNVGLPILLSEENGWAYTWTGLSEKTGYSVAEARVPEHYTASVRQLGERDFVVINTRVISTVVPPTGDQSQVLLWCFGMLFGMIGTFTIRKRIKR